MAFVALRKESVDRNLLGRFFVFVWFVVALRKESVDRNRCWFSLRLRPSRSLSARRAWIEIVHNTEIDKHDGSLSARRAWIEITSDAENRKRLESLSARRAWIEIDLTYSDGVVCGVALRKESVDRNFV